MADCRTKLLRESGGLFCKNKHAGKAVTMVEFTCFGAVSYAAIISLGSDAINLSRFSDCVENILEMLIFTAFGRGFLSCFRLAARNTIQFLSPYRESYGDAVRYCRFRTINLIKPGMQVPLPSS
uniref:Uncharacterized protein n=1 Tax=Candidatus Kentrum sp. FW TaxID=2126338 RepID=A0A450ST30_9GAMM|nr:MAG: hypothetical protein BECKFW1821A_GA0114235_106710 [Candidatus Kentron sp. FW]